MFISNVKINDLGFTNGQLNLNLEIREKKKKCNFEDLK